MEDQERIVSSTYLNMDEDAEQDQSLRPKTLDEYIGQENCKKQLDVYIQAAKLREETLDHVLFYGPPGLGKTTLSMIIANEMNANIKITSGPAIERAGDLAAILTNLTDRDVLFIDEIHRLNRTVEEILYPAMEDGCLDLIIGKGPSARSIRIDLPKFTLIGATTRSGMLTSPLRDRFGVVLNLEMYRVEELIEILNRSARLLHIALDPDAALEIARRARGTPRIANRLLKRVRDFAQVLGDGVITFRLCKDALNILNVDEAGLDSMDKRILLLIIEKFGGGPVGIETIAASLGEDRDTIESVYEPYLLQQGFVQRTSRGRIASDTAYQHFGIERQDTE